MGISKIVFEAEKASDLSIDIYLIITYKYILSRLLCIVRDSDFLRLTW